MCDDILITKSSEPSLGGAILGLFFALLMVVVMATAGLAYYKLNHVKNVETSDTNSLSVESCSLSVPDVDGVVYVLVVGCPGKL